MKNSYQYILLFLVLTGAFASCTQTRDGWTYRAFHNTTARYNGYFYAKESMKEADAKILSKFTEDYDQVLPLFIYGSEADAQAAYPELERAIEKSSLVIDRHKMDVPKSKRKKSKRPEMNKWIDDNYLLIGQAYFYKQNYFKAEEFFKYVVKKYETPDMQVSSNIWLAKTYMQRGDYRKAAQSLEKAKEVKSFPQEMLAEYSLVAADYHLRQDQYKEAAKKIEEALPFIKKKSDRARPTFILAQLYERTGKSQDAIDKFQTVLKLRPPTYEMEFYAQINQALAFNRRGGNSTEIREKLDKMLKDEKNLEYNDQIYYAVADLDIEERDFESGVVNLQNSLEASVGNKKQKGKTFLRLADIYFDERNYGDAQAYYDSTAAIITEEHPRYSDIRNKAESLTELVLNLNVIEQQDSLLRLSELEPEDLRSKVAEIRDADIAEIQRIYDEQQAAIAAGETIAGLGSSDYWCYNQKLRDKGLDNFQSYWGERKLEDNWRRSVKVQFSFSDEEPTNVEETVQEEFSAEAQVPTLDEYLANIPSDPASIRLAKDSVAGAHYNAGLIYKEKLDDFDNGIESFEVLTDRFEESDYHIMAFYQLYRSYLNKEKEGYSNPFCSTCNSEHWGQIILNQYPDSEYAELVRNPDFLAIEELKNSRESAYYEEVYNLYRRRNYNNVALATDSIIKTEPENHLLSKHYLLRALSRGEVEKQFGQTDNFVASLQEVVGLFESTEEAERAQEILDILNGVEKEEPIKEDPKELSAEDLDKGEFKCSDQSEHWFVIMFEKSVGNPNEIKAAISDFNSESFKSTSLRLTSSLLGSKQVVVVKKFGDRPAALDYYKTFVANTDKLAKLNGEGYDKVVITKKNYITLFKNKDLEGYQAFFEACFLSQP